MKHFGKILLSAVTLTAVAAVFLSAPSKPIKASGSAPVMVTNTPLPVSGTVAVSNFPSTQQVSGTVNANVTFPSSIAVTNPVDGASQPIPLTTREDKDLVGESFATSICAGGSGLTSCSAAASLSGLSYVPPTSFNVPTTDSAGNTVKGLVIQFISGVCSSSEVALSTSAGANALNSVNPVLNFLDDSTGYVKQTTSIVVPPGSTVGIFGSPSSPCWLSLYGYLAH